MKRKVERKNGVDIKKNKVGGKRTKKKMVEVAREGGKRRKVDRTKEKNRMYWNR